MEIDKSHREQFISDVRRLGFDDPFLENYYNMMVLQGLEQHQLNETIDCGDDRVLYRLDLKPDEAGLPALQGYTATLLKTHPVRHGVFEGIDTRTLENRLKQGDWKINMDEFSDLYEQITRLTISGNTVTMDIAQRLEARYLMGTVADSHINTDWLKLRFGRDHYFDISEPFGEITPKQAYNLMSLRPVIRFMQSAPNHFRGYWFSLKPFKPAVALKEGKWFEELYQEGFDLATKLRELSVREMETKRGGTSLIRQLIEGDLALATMNMDGKWIPVRLSVNPEEKSLVIYDGNLREISLDTYLEKNKGEKKGPITKKNKGKSKGI